MFNINKTTETKASDVAEYASQLVDNAESNVNHIAQDVKASATDLNKKIQKQGKETKEDVYQLVDSLKSLLAQYTDSSKADQIKNQLVDKAIELKGVVQDEVTHAYNTSKDRTVQTVQDKPILSLAVALGAGVLVGYILGTKQSSK
jgi:ElaB/YqjD/DUF883 family membrane-anchored ribosome-binding protein